MNNEAWRPVLGYKHRYEVSNLGRVYSCITGQELAQRHRPDGYMSIKFARKEYRIHRLVWEAFNGRIEKDYEINHIDGDKTNNRLDNLESVTRSENLKHAYATGLMDVSGENNPNSKLTESDVAEIKRLHSFGYGYTKLGRMYNISRYTVRDIIKRGAWGNHK